MSTLAPILQAFFTTRLGTERDVSPHTVDSYRHTFRCCPPTRERTGNAPSDLKLGDLDTTLVSSFLNHWSTIATVASAPATLARHPPLLLPLRLLSPPRAYGEDPAGAGGLPPEEDRDSSPILPHRGRDGGAARRSRSRQSDGARRPVVLALALQTGLRLLELTGLRCQDVELHRTRTLSSPGERDDDIDIAQHPVNELHAEPARARDCPIEPDPFLKEDCTDRAPSRRYRDLVADRRRGPNTWAPTQVRRTFEGFAEVPVPTSSPLT